MYSIAFNLLTFTRFVHFELPFRLKGTDKIHTEKFSKFSSDIYSIFFVYTVYIYILCKPQYLLIFPIYNIHLQILNNSGFIHFKQKNSNFPYL